MRFGMLGNRSWRRDAETTAAIGPISVPADRVRPSDDAAPAASHRAEPSDPPTGSGWSLLSSLDDRAAETAGHRQSPIGIHTETGRDRGPDALAESHGLTAAGAQSPGHSPLASPWTTFGDLLQGAGSSLTDRDGAFGFDPVLWPGAGLPGPARDGAAPSFEDLITTALRGHNTNLLHGLGDGFADRLMEALTLADALTVPVSALAPSTAKGLKIWRYDAETGDVVDLTAEFRGFDDANNRYPWSMTMHDNALVVGTLNINPFTQLGNGTDQTVSSNGGEIWTYTAAAGWREILDASEFPGTDAGDIGFRELITYDGDLFAATSNNLVPGLLQGSDNVAKILRYDGAAWDQLSGGPLADPANASIRTMTTHDGDLVVGTEGGNQVWAYDGSAWTELTGSGDAVEGVGVGEVISFNGDLFFADYGALPWNLYTLDNGSVANVTPTAIDGRGPDAFAEDTSPFDDQGVLKLFAWQDYLYLGTVDYLDGATLIRSQTPSDPSSWEAITTDGFASELSGVADLGATPALLEGNAYVWSLAGSGATTDSAALNIGTFNGIQGQAQLIQLIETTGGVELSLVDKTAFGTGDVYGHRSMESDGSDVYIGGASNALVPDVSGQAPWFGDGLDVFG